MTQEQPPKSIENVRDRFMDYIGNPLSGVLGYSDAIAEGALSPDSSTRLEEGLVRSWSSLFERLEIFLASDFTAVGNIDREHIARLLDYKERDPHDARVVAELVSAYRSLVREA